MKYIIYKGIDRRAMWRGLPLIFWAYLFVAFFLGFVGFFVMTAIGIPIAVASILCVGLFIFLFFLVKKFENKYGAYGFKKRRARDMVGTGVTIKSARSILRRPVFYDIEAREIDWLINSVINGEYVLGKSFSIQDNII